MSDASDADMTLEWLLQTVDESGDGELADAAIVALGTDRLADPSDELPDPDSTDRRGWWGDINAEELHEGWPIGCRVWLLARESITPAEARRGSTIARADQYVREALQPFVDRKIATRVTVTAERIGLDRIAVNATMYRGGLPAVDLRYAVLWNRIRP